MHPCRGRTAASPARGRRLAFLSPYKEAMQRLGVCPLSTLEGVLSDLDRSPASVSFTTREGRLYFPDLLSNPNIYDAKHRVD